MFGVIEFSARQVCEGCVSPCVCGNSVLVILWFYNKNRKIFYLKTLKYCVELCYAE